MKKKLSVLTISLLFLGVLVSVKVVYFTKRNPTNYKHQLFEVDNIPETKTDEGNKLSEINTTWGEFLDLYMKENHQVTNYNPRQDVNKDHKVRVVKTEYPNGLKSMVGVFRYVIITRVYDTKTDELLTSNFSM